MYQSLNTFYDYPDRSYGVTRVFSSRNQTFANISIWKLTDKLCMYVSVSAYFRKCFHTEDANNLTKVATSCFWPDIVDSLAKFNSRWVRYFAGSIYAWLGYSFHIIVHCPDKKTIRSLWISRQRRWRSFIIIVYIFTEKSMSFWQKGSYYLSCIYYS